MGVTGDDEEPEYESDPEEAPLPLTMRRREASDDEEGDVEEEREKLSRMDPRVGIDSDVESDGQGGAPGYYDEESEIEEEVDVDEEEIEEYVVERDGEDNNRDNVEFRGIMLESGGDGQRSGADLMEFGDKNQGEGEKKENEPFAVPTAGAFYMHDDRFRENGAAARHRRTPGGKKLWESKDDKKWGHDKFEELNLQETHYDKQRKKGPYRGRGKKQGTDHGYVRGNRSRTYTDSNNQNNAPKTVRGRGPRRYEPPTRNNGDAPPNPNKQSGKSYETTMNNNSTGRASSHTYSSHVQPNPAPPRKHVFASSLSSASPPFYPSSSSNQDVAVTQKRDVQAGASNRNLPPVLCEEKFSMSNSNPLLGGKTVVDPLGKDRLNMDEPIRPIIGKLSNMQLQSSGSLPANSTQSPLYRAKGRGSDIAGQLSYQSTSSPNFVNIGSMQLQLGAVQQKPVSAVKPVRVSTQQIAQQRGGGSQASSPPKGSSTNSSERGETESPTGSSKSKTALVSKGKDNVQGSGRGPFVYNGAHVIGTAGNMGVSHGDNNFHGTPALLPVMQFGGQHSGGLGVPAVGMALPGYVAQPQLGFGNSEMTWVPVLAGSTGAIGAPYCSPYLPVDSGYCSRPSGQTSSSGVSRDASTDKPNSAWKPPPQRPAADEIAISTELVNDEFGQRQNKPRRYSEMNFGQ